MAGAASEGGGRPPGAFRQVARNANLRRLELAWAGSMVGTWAYGTAVLVYAYGQDGARGVGILASARWIAAAISSPFTGVLGDRFARARVMVISDAIRAAALVGAAAIVLAGGPAIAVYLLSGVVTIVSTAFRPAQAALVPALARTPEELTAANVVSSTIESVGIFAGPAIAGLLLAVTSSGIVFLLTAGLLVASAVLVVRISVRDDREPRSARGPGAIAAGFRAVLGERKLRLLVGLFAAQTFVDGALTVLIVVSSIDLLGLGKGGVGFLNSASGIGGILGAVVAGALVGRARLAGTFGAGILLWGLPIAVVGLWPSGVAALVMLGVVGVGNTLVDVAGMTLLQRAAPEEVMARVFGVLGTVTLGSVGLGAAAAPLLVSTLGVRGALGVTGALLPVLAALSWLPLARIDREAAAPGPELELLRGVPIFAPLPEATLERLAGLLTPSAVSAGQAIFRLGDTGDRFYVIAAGEVEIAPESRAPSLHGRGGYFGEIALLRNVPRTATVTARTDVQLLALESDEFISAVTGHAPSNAAADSVIGARLGLVAPL